MLVSIIIPIYNVEKYIVRCLESVLNQTYRQLEVILVDDGSSDGSMKKAEELIEGCLMGKDLRFRYLAHGANRGQSAARNTGLDIATGDYIFFLDSDDEITSDCIETLVALSDGGKIDYVRGSHLLMTSTKQVFQEIILDDVKVYEEKIIRKLYTNHRLFVTVWNALIKTKLARNVKFYEGIVLEDVLWNFVIINMVSSLSSVSHVTYFNYGRPDSTMNTLSDKRSNDCMMIVFGEMDRLYKKGIIKKEKENKKYIIERKGERLFKISKNDQLDRKLKLEYTKRIVGMQNGISVLAYFSFLYLYDKVYIRIKNVLKH